jgi:membrane protein insertase Oxa1/YidC/SpoIIIJ
MTEQETQEELLTRFELVEMMVKEGRRSTEYWGWTFVLWGAAYLIAIGWSFWLHQPNIAWPVTMIVATVVTITVASKKKRAKPQTPISRAIGGIWTAVGTAIFIFCFAVGISGHAEMHVYLATVEFMLGIANCAISMTLRWRGQLLIALLWWISAVVTLFVASQWIMPILVLDTLIGFLGFGLYLMYRERRDRRLRVQHA